MIAPTARELRVFLVVGEHSGDQLGVKLMCALREAVDGGIAFFGTGGDAMEAEGLRSLFPLADIAVMGILPVIARLPTLLARIRQTARAVVATRPDVLVIIDSPDFTHRVARLARKKLPDLPVVDYVSPSIWAWRPGRAKAMRAYVDCLLALLPFEPAAHQRLGGPPCFYVGHPLIERLDELRPDATETVRRAAAPPLIVTLPGSRRSVISRMVDDFGAALSLLAREIGPVDAVVPTFPHLAAEISERVATWSVPARVVIGEAAKFAAFRRARAALAASGTVTLELALAGVPMVGAYKVSRLEEPLKYFVKIPPLILLPNLILGERAIPEILQGECTPENLSRALVDVVREGAPRRAQIAALARLDGLMRLPDGDAPSARAARLVLRTIAGRATRAPS
jgi:lipid-A-disaccharide synthase